MNITFMFLSNRACTPNCGGCDYLEETDWTCDHIGKTGNPG